MLFLYCTQKFNQEVVNRMYNLPGGSHKHKIAKPMQVEEEKKQVKDDVKMSELGRSSPYQ